MSQLFEVEFTVRAVVVADDVAHAYQVAHNSAREIASDDGMELVEVGHTILEPKHLPLGWEIGCYPYGANDNKTIGQHLAELATKEP